MQLSDTRWVVVGINHRRADVARREAFALSETAQRTLLEAVRAAGVPAALVVSTCNRTELYARMDCPAPAIQLLLSHTQGSGTDFQEVGFVLHGKAAIQHLFLVTTGLDSLVLGDLQISQQVKQSYKLSSELGLADGYLHKLMQHVLRAHKRARRETSIGSGAASVAHAAVQYVRQTQPDLGGLKLLLVGAGKIGKVTLKNLVGMGARQVCLVNRDRNRADRLAAGVEVRVADFGQLTEEIAWADVVIVATGAQQPVIRQEHVQTGVRKMLIDLSVPRNVAPELEDVPDIQVVNMDQLATVIDDTRLSREAARADVEAIISSELADFALWLSHQRLTPTIKALTAKLESIKQLEIDQLRNRLAPEALAQVEWVTSRIVNKILAQQLGQLRAANGHQGDLLQAVRELYDLNTETGA